MKKLIMRLWRLAALLLLLLSFSHCSGGGTTGTGDIGGSVTIRGIIQDINGAILPESTITLLESGESVQSDTEGRFELATTVPFGQPLSLLAEGEDFDLTTSIGTLEEGEELIELALEVNVSSQTLTVLDLELESPSETEDPEAPGISDSETSDTEEKPRKIRITGVLTYLDESAVEKAILRIRGSSKRASTDTEGNFALRISSDTRDITLRINLGDTNETVTLDNLPAKGDLRITIALRINLLPPNSLITQDIFDLTGEINLESIDIAQE